MVRISSRFVLVVLVLITCLFNQVVIAAADECGLMVIIVII